MKTKKPNCYEPNCKRPFTPEKGGQYYCSEECAWVGMLRREGGNEARIAEILAGKEAKREALRQNLQKANAAKARKKEAAA